jgi:hypothetical protein
VVGGDLLGQASLFVQQLNQSYILCSGVDISINISSRSNNSNFFVCRNELVGGGNLLAQASLIVQQLYRPFTICPGVDISTNSSSSSGNSNFFLLQERTGGRRISAGPSQHDCLKC